MAELGDALGSGPSTCKGVGVQIPFPAYAALSGIDCFVRLISYTTGIDYRKITAVN